MRLFLAALGLAAISMTTAPARAQTPPPAPPDGRIHVIAYVETNPGATAKTIAALRAYRDATLKEPGAEGARLYREIGRQNRFVVDETWASAATQSAHGGPAKLAEALKNGHLAPADIRAHTEWSMGPQPQATGAAALFAFTHIDVGPPNLPALQDILKTYLAKSREDKGLLRFDLLQGLAPRLNHETLAEAWTSEAAFRDHQAAAHAVEFRDKLGPLLGALYDQRLYRALK